MQTSESTHSGGCAQEVSGLFGREYSWPCTYRTAVYHATRHGDSWWKMETLSLQSLIDLTDIVQLVTSFGCCGPGLDAFEDLRSNIVVDSGWADGFQQGSQVVHELSRGYFDQKVLSSILDARICELYNLVSHGKASPSRWAVEGRSNTYVEGAQLCVRVLVAYTLLE